MVSIITGNILKSNKVNQEKWLKELRDVLNSYGSSPGDWEIFKNDHFMLKVDAENSLRAAIHIKAAMTNLKPLRVKIGIGIGDITSPSQKITLATGSAMLRASHCYEKLRKRNLGVQSGNKRNDALINLMFDLSALSIDGWSSVAAGVVRKALENRQATQSELAEMLGITQSNISRGLKRAGFEEVMRMNDYYKEIIQQN